LEKAFQCWRLRGVASLGSSPNGFPALVRRNWKNDMASGGFWKALAIYCDNTQKKLFGGVTMLSKAQSEDQNISRGIHSRCSAEFFEFG